MILPQFDGQRHISSAGVFAATVFGHYASLHNRSVDKYSQSFEWGDLESDAVQVSWMCAQHIAQVDNQSASKVMYNILMQHVGWTAADLWLQHYVRDDVIKELEGEFGDGSDRGRGD